jgi:hypothetical protein
MNIDVPRQGITTLPASFFVWGRIVGRASCAEKKIPLKHWTEELTLISDTTSKQLKFVFNGVKSPIIRGRQITPYAEYICVIEGHLKLKIHLAHPGYTT